MRRIPNRLIRYAAMASAFAVFACASIGAAWADTFGHLRITLKNPSGAPITGAKVVFHDTANMRPDVEAQTDAEGVVVSPALEHRDWEVRIELGGAQLAPQTVTVVADTVTDVDVVADASTPAAPSGKKDATVNVIRKALGIIEAVRSKRFTDLFPVTAGQELGIDGLLKTIPGFTSGSTGQVFSRGDQALGTFLVNGLRLPETFFGQFTDNITANLLTNLEAMTGGLPAEYAGLASSVVNMNLQGGTLEPKNGINLFGGTFATFKGAFMASGQLGRQIGEPDANGRAARNLGYFLSLSDRRTDNTVSNPQPDEEEENNESQYNNFFGNFDYRPNQKDQWNILLNVAPSKTDVPNRAGLGSNWPTQGLGFGGLFSDNRGTQGFPSQAAMGLDVHNEGISNFGLLSWRRKQDENTDWVVSFGASHVGDDQGHNNPSVDVMNLPFNSSQEYNPNIARNNRSWQAQGSYHRKTGKHDFKIGFFLDESDGRESYQMIPGSDLAMNALYAADPRLVPAGNEDGTDILGNPQYFVTSGSVPTLRTATKRQNRSLFFQDDWKPSDRLSVNYGARWDSFKGTQNLGLRDTDESMVSPRVSFAYQHDHRTVIKGSFNRLFQAPPLVQGEMIGSTPKVGIANQFDLSFERAIGGTSSLRVTAYKKTTDDYLYIRQMIPGLIDGPQVGVNYDEAESSGVEFSMQMLPVNGMGLSGFLTWTNSSTKASGMGTDGSSAPSLPTDQRNVLTAGMNYMWANGANWALSWDFGSGMPTTDLYGLGVGLDDRRSHSKVNFRFQSSQTAFGPFGGFTIDIENVFDNNTVFAFNSPVSGTTFQQGRRIVISAFSQFLTR